MPEPGARTQRTAVFAAKGNVLKLFVVRGEVVKKVDGPLRVEAESITAGTSSECDLCLADPIAAARHCRLRLADSGFEVEDLESRTGTYVNAAMVAGRSPLRDGDEITIGTTRLLCKVGSDGGKPLLTLDTRARMFRFAEFKKVFPSAPAQYLSDRDLWAYTEAGTLEERAGKAFVSRGGLGRFRFLLPANLLAGLVAAALLAAFIALRASFGDRLVDPGPLCRSHAQLFSGTPAAFTPPGEVALAREQGCGVCHEAGSGVPQSRCARCHAELFGERGQHPFRDADDMSFDAEQTSRPWRSNECVYCHQEHLGPGSREGGFIPSPARTQASCADCHRGSLVEAGGFQTRRGADPPPLREREHAAYRFGHRDHVGLEHAETGEKITCQVCHTADSDAVADGASAARDRDLDQKDFRPVPFSTCARCHVENASGGRSFGRDESLRGFWPRKRDELGREVNVWSLRWHGSSDPDATCTACHIGLHQKEIKTTTRARLSAAQIPESKARFEVERRTHTAELLEHAQGQACEGCHRRGAREALPRKAAGYFWHAYHMPQLTASGAGQARELSKACAACHDDLAASTALANEGEKLFTWLPESCTAACHRETVRPGDTGRPLLLQPLPPTAPWEKEARAEFPHKQHLKFTPGGKLENGCYTCHTFEPVPGGQTFALVPGTKPEASKCETCHAGHDEVAGGSCRGCHPIDPDGGFSDFWGHQPPPERSRPRKSWPQVNTFNHFSPGHKESSCSECHDAVSEEPRSLRQAASIKDVSIPGEEAAPCRQCHLKSKQRFHWR